MPFTELLFIGVGLAADAFAVAMCRGLEAKRFTWKNGLLTGLFFGFFQAAMPVIGYYLATLFAEEISAFDHWIAFGLLLYLGGKMVYESRQEKQDECHTDPLSYKTLCGLAIATSIDALAVGISLACLESAIALAALTIGVVTFLLSAFGVYFGNRFGRKVDLKLDLIGGLILIAIGAKILIEHLYLNK